MNDLRKRFIAKSDQQLLAIVTKERSDYTPEAVALAETILNERSVQFQAPALPGKIIQEKGPEPSAVFFPLIGGIALVLLALADPVRTTDADTAFTVNLTINIFIRVIVVVWLVNLAKTFLMQRTLWIILGLLFGGWALIAANLAIWMLKANLDVYVPDNADSAAKLESDHGHSDKLNHCPACETLLNGSEGVCPNCGLSLM